MQLNTTHNLNKNLLLWYLVTERFSLKDTKVRSITGAATNGSYSLTKPVHGLQQKRGVSSNRGAFVFNGTGYIQFPSLGIFSGSSDYTYSLWIYPTQLNPQHYMIFQTRAEWDTALVIFSGSQYACFWYDGITHEATYNTVLLNKWTHLTVVWDKSAGLMRLYVNGIQQSTVNTASAGDINSVSDINCIGSQYYSGSNHENFVGLMDDFRIWNRALSSTEVLQLYGISSRGNRELFIRKSNITAFGIQNSTTTLSLNIPFNLEALSLKKTQQQFPLETVLQASKSTQQSIESLLSSDKQLQSMLETILQTGDSIQGQIESTASNNAQLAFSLEHLNSIGFQLDIAEDSICQAVSQFLFNEESLSKINSTDILLDTEVIGYISAPKSFDVEYISSGEVVTFNATINIETTLPISTMIASSIESILNIHIDTDNQVEAIRSVDSISMIDLENSSSQKIDAYVDYEHGLKISNDIYGQVEIIETTKSSSIINIENSSLPVFDLSINYEHMFYMSRMMNHSVESIADINHTSAICIEYTVNRAVIFVFAYSSTGVAVVEGYTDWPSLYVLPGFDNTEFTVESSVVEIESQNHKSEWSV